MRHSMPECQNATVASGLVIREAVNVTYRVFHSCHEASPSVHGMRRKRMERKEYHSSSDAQSCQSFPVYVYRVRLMRLYTRRLLGLSRPSP